METYSKNQYKDILNKYLRSSGDYSSAISSAVDEIGSLKKGDYETFLDKKYTPGGNAMNRLLGDSIASDIGAVNNSDIIDYYKEKLSNRGIELDTSKSFSGNSYDTKKNLVNIDKNIVKRLFGNKDDISELSAILDHEYGHTIKIETPDSDPAHWAQIFKQHTAPSKHYESPRIDRYMKSIGTSDDVAAHQAEAWKLMSPNDRELFFKDKISPYTDFEIMESGHHPVMPEIFPELKNPEQMKSWEARRLLQKIYKSGGVLPAISNITGAVGKIADYYEAQKDPNFTEDEGWLRAIDAIAPNEQTERDIEYMKLMREHLST